MKQTRSIAMIFAAVVFCLARGEVLGNDLGPMRLPGARRVAASSAAWGWLFPTIPKAFGFEAATQSKKR